MANLIITNLRAIDPGIDDPTADKMLTQYTAICDGIVSHIEEAAVVTCTIPAEAIATAGSPAAQVGPPAPVPITGEIA